MIPERARAGMKNEPDRLDRVVRNGESFDRDIADGKSGAGAENTPVAMFA